MKKLTINYLVVAVGLHKSDDEFHFILSDDEGKSIQVTVEPSSAPAVLASLLRVCQAENETLAIDCLCEGAMIATPSHADHIADTMLAPFKT